MRSRERAIDFDSPPRLTGARQATAAPFPETCLNPTSTAAGLVTIPPPRAERRALYLRRAAQRLELEAVRAGSARRNELEQYVRAAFACKHGAAVRTFMPTLLSFRDRSGVLRGVVGVRGAHEEPLYLEQYLDLPIESALAAALAQRPRASAHGTGVVVRSDIVEVGNLAGGSCRAAVRMVSQLPSYLLELRYRWIVFTATSALRGILREPRGAAGRTGRGRAAAHSRRVRRMGPLLRDRPARVRGIPWRRPGPGRIHRRGPRPLAHWREHCDPLPPDGLR